MGRVAVAALGAAALLVVGAACGERSEPTGPGSDLYPVTVQSANGGQPLVLKRPARRIVVLAPSAKRLLAALGASRQVVGLPLAQNGSLLVGTLRSLKPDLIVASTTTDDTIVREAARAVPNAPLYQAPDDSIRGVEETITELGLLAGRPGGATRLVQAIERKRALVRKRLAGTMPVGVFLDTGLFITVSNQSLAADLLREAHGHNVAGESAGAGPFDLQELLRLQPRWYLATSDSGTTLERLRKGTLTKKLEAIKAGRFAIVPAGLLAPGPAIGDGLVGLARVLHPNAFR
jgi:ABC-type Fe3+-hydroxamate transport system substrate-binding protein